MLWLGVNCYVCYQKTSWAERMRVFVCELAAYRTFTKYLRAKSGILQFFPSFNYYRCTPIGRGGQKLGWEILFSDFAALGLISRLITKARLKSATVGVNIRGGSCNYIEGGVPVINKVWMNLGVPHKNDHYY